MVKGKDDNSMKVILIIALIITFVGGYLIARARYKPQILELNKMVLDKDSDLTKMKANANKVMMKDNVMWVIKDGIVSEMLEEVTLSNGSKVGVDGKVTNPDGSEVMLQNNESMDMNGEMIPKDVESFQGF